MKEKDDIELGIDPKPINETEERQLSLLLNLIRSRQGLSFVQIRQIMKEFYSNSNIESDQKKLQRDIEELKENGFAIKFYKVAHESMEYNVYRMDESQRDARIVMSDEELRKFSFLILKKSEENASNDLFTIKNKTPLKIEYFKTNPKESYFREIEPLQIIKRNSEDFYLIVYDREKKQKRRFLIPKILKISDLSGEFLFTGKIEKNDLNYHALNFAIHESESLEITCNSESAWKLEKFLHPHPFKKVGNIFLLSTNNRSALFNFILRENDCIEKINSESFLKEFKAFLSKIKKNYSLI